MLKSKRNRSYGSPRIQETVFSQETETRNRKKQRGRSNLGGAPAPSLPWRPWTRGGTLLPSRGEAKEEEGGGLSPPLSRWRRNTVGARIVTAIYVNNLAAVNTNSPPLCNGVTPLLPAVIST